MPCIVDPMSMQRLPAGLFRCEMTHLLCASCHQGYCSPLPTMHDGAFFSQIITCIALQFECNAQNIEKAELECFQC